MLCFYSGLKRTIGLGTTHQTVGINNPTPLFALHPPAGARPERLEMKQTPPEGGALILGNGRGKSPETPGSPRPPEGAGEAEGGVREEL